MSNAPTTIAASMSETEVEAEKAAQDAKLKAVAKSLGKRIWNRNITTDSGLSLALIANQERSGVQDVETLRKAIAEWIRGKHGKKVDTVHYTEAMKSILRS